MRLLTLTILVSVLIGACTPAEPVKRVNNDKLAEVMARGTLVIATDADYAPQSRLISSALPEKNTKCAPTQYTANQMEGFDVDVAVEIARRLGVEPCFVTPPWSQLIAGKWQNNWDIHVGSVAITYERMKVLYFSQPYYATPTVILVHKDNTSIKRPEDLSGKQVGVCAGCIPEYYLNGNLKLPGQDIQYLIKNAKIIAYQNEAPAIEDLSKGDGVILDGILTILPLAKSAIEQGKPVKIVGDPILFGYACVTVDRFGNRDPSSFLAEITRIIQSMHADGMLKKLSMQHLGIDLTQEAAAFDISKIDQTP